MLGINLHRIFELLDLREENTLATWFSSIIFLTVGASFLLLGWGSSPNFTVSRPARRVFQLTTIGAVLLSADEVASIHETVGKWFRRVVSYFWDHPPVDNNGYFWIVLFAPLLLGGLLFMTYFLQKIIANISNPVRQRKMVYFTLFVALICLPGVFVFEVFEWYFDSVNQKTAILTCWEETFELIGMYSLFLCATLVARQYQL